MSMRKEKDYYDRELPSWLIKALEEGNDYEKKMQI